MCWIDAELAGPDAVVQLDHLRMEAAVVADADHALGLAHRVDRGFGLLLGEGERLLAIDVLAGGRGGLDLLADGRTAASPARPRRSWDRRAPPRSCRPMRSECCLAKASTSGVTVRVCSVVKRMSVAAAGKRLHHRLAPGAQSDNRRVDHAVHSRSFARLYLGQRQHGERDAGEHPEHAIFDAADHPDPFPGDLVGRGAGDATDGMRRCQAT